MRALVISIILLSTLPAMAQTEPADLNFGVAVGPVRFQPRLEARTRGEVRVDPYGGDTNDQFFLLHRTRLGFEARLDPVRLVVDVQDARAFGEYAPGTDGGSNTAIHEGYLELHWDFAWIRIGRQEIDYDRQRMIGAFNWATAARSFDAVRAHFDIENFELDMMGAVVNRQQGLNGGFSDGDYLAAIHGRWSPCDAFALSPYVLFRHDGPTDTSLDQNRDIAALGLRGNGSTHGLTYDAEGVLEVGDDGGSSFLAYAAAGDVRYAIDSSLAPTFLLGGSLASGATTSGDVDEFDNFFPTNHSKYGAADLFGWRNMFEGFVGFSVKPGGVTLGTTAHLFGLLEPGSRWSTAGGATVGENASNTDRLMGMELDLNVKWSPIERVDLSTGYALFLPFTGAENLGQPDPTHWAYVMIGAHLP